MLSCFVGHQVTPPTFADKQNPPREELPCYPADISILNLVEYEVYKEYIGVVSTIAFYLFQDGGMQGHCQK